MVSSADPEMLVCQWKTAECGYTSVREGGGGERGWGTEGAGERGRKDV